MLDAPPTVKAIGPNELTITWQRWRSKSSPSDGVDSAAASAVVVASYAVEILERTTTPATPWREVASVAEDSVSGNTFWCSIKHLSSEQYYKLRITIVWMNSNKPQRSTTPGPETDWTATLCPSKSSLVVVDSVFGRTKGCSFNKFGWFTEKLLSVFLHSQNRHSTTLSVCVHISICNRL